MKLKNCPLCGHSVNLVEDTVSRQSWRLKITCVCGLEKWRQPSGGPVYLNYEQCRTRLIEQWNHRPQLEEAYEALRAYNVISSCPGMETERGAISGCSGGPPADCPTCAVVDAAENE